MGQFEFLEPRWALASPTLAAIDDVTLLAGAPLNIGLDGADADGDTLTYTVTSTNSAVTATLTPSTNRYLQIEVDSDGNGIHGTIVLELFEDLAPKTTARIIQLAQSGFYDGLKFHRVIEDFMIQGGDPQGTGSGGSGTEFDDEYNASLRFTGRGLLAMAKTNDDTNDSQFFITSAATRWLDFNHTIFGMLVEGDDILAAVESVTTDDDDVPTSDVIMTSVEVVDGTQNGVLRLSAPKGTTGTSTVTVQVNDGHGNTASQSFLVTLGTDSTTETPFFSAIDPIRTSVNTPVSITLPATDVNGNAMYYSAVANSNDTSSVANLTVTVNDTTGLVTVTPKSGVSGVYSIEVKVASSTSSLSSTSGYSWDYQQVPVYVSPAAPVIEKLMSDTGSSITTTNRNNSSLDRTLTFRLSGLTTGAQVTLKADGVVIGQGIASAATMDLPTNGSTTLTNGTHSITAVQTLLNKAVAVGNLSTTTDLESPASNSFSITVDTAVTVADFTKNVAVDTTLTFAAADFTSHFSDPDTSESLQTVKITQLPTHGTLKLNGTAVTLNQEIAVANLSTLTYQATTGYTGSDSVKWNGKDSTTYAAADATITINLVADVPVVSDFTKNVAVSTTLTFTAADFTSHFTDYNAAHSLQTVKITQLPTHGTLKLNGTAVTLNQEIAASSLATLTYQPTTGYTGSDTVNWNGSDGTTYAASSATITINSVADVPVLTDSTKTVAEDTTLTFAAADFTANFIDYSATHSLQKVKITQLPTHGTLKLNGTAVTVNQEIASVDLATLTYLGNTNYHGSDALQWNGSDGTTYASTAATMTLTVTAANDAPTLTDFAKSVVDDTVLTFAATDFSAHFSDLDSDALSKVKIIQLPAHGTLKLNGTAVTVSQEIAAADLGKLTYQATGGYGGADTFKWNASDGTSYAAADATATITIGSTGVLSGWAYLDSNNNGQRDANEIGLPGVVIKLSRKGNDGTWTEVTDVSPIMSASDGSFQFESLTAGTYEIRQVVQPATYVDGKDTAGTAGGSVENDRIYDIELAADAAGTGYLFGEQGLQPAKISKRLFLRSTPGSSKIIQKFNQAPVVDLNGTGSTETGRNFSAAYVSGSDAVHATAVSSGTSSGAAVTDADSSYLDSLTVTLTYRPDGDSEVLAATTTDTSITASYSAGVLTLQGPDTLANFQTVLRSVTYKNTATAPTAGDRSLTFVASDGISSSNVATATVTMGLPSDQAAPTATVTTAPPAINAASGSTSTTTLVVTYSDSGGGIDTTSFDTSDLTVSNGATVTSVSASGNAVTYTITAPASTWSASTQGTYTVSLAANQVKDLAGNYVAANSSLTSFAVDTVVPTVTINQASAQSDPANASPIHFTVVFSEAVSDFASGDVTLSGTASGTLAATVTASGTDGKTYDVAVTGMTGTGTVIATIGSGAAHDAAGNANTASTSTDNSVTYDTAVPTVTINQASTQSDPSNGSTIYFTAVFSEAVSDFASDDVTLSGTAAGTLAATVTASGTDGTTYTVAVTGMTGSGTVIATIAAGKAHNNAGNANAASTSTDNSVTYDVTAPTVTINQASTQSDPSNGSTIYFTAVFSEAVSDFATGDVTFGGTATGTLVGTVTASGTAGTTYTIAVTGMTGGGTVIPSIAAGKAHDAAGNANTASTSTDSTVTYDVTAPTVTIDQASTQSDPTDGSTIHFTVVFSEAVSDFATGDVTLSGTAAGTLVGTVTASGTAGTTYDVAVSGMTGSGTVIASIAAGAAHDAAGNANAASTSTDNSVTYEVDTSGATVVRNGTQVNVTGTSDDDTFEFLVGSGEYIVIANGELHEFAASEVSSFHFNGGGGYDSVQLTGGDGAQTAEIHPGSASFEGQGFTVDVVNAKDIRIDAGDGDSEVELFDSAGDDTLIAQGTLATLFGSDFSETAMGFLRVKASGTAGGENTASVAATDYVLTRLGSWVDL